MGRTLHVSPASEVDANRPLGPQHDLASILSHVEQRVIGADYTIRHERQLFQIKREHIRPGWQGKRIRMERRLDGTVAARGPDGALEITSVKVASVRRQLELWQRTRALEGVRSADALARLPAEEREGWQKFWDEVQALLQPD